MNLIERLNLISNPEKALSRYFTFELNEFQQKPFNRLWSENVYVDLDCDRAVGKTQLGWMMSTLNGILGHSSLMIFPRLQIADPNVLLSIMTDNAKETFLDGLAKHTIRFKNGGKILLVNAEYSSDNLLGVRTDFQYFDEFDSWEPRCKDIAWDGLHRATKTLVLSSRGS